MIEIVFIVIDDQSFESSDILLNISYGVEIEAGKEFQAKGAQSVPKVQIESIQASHYYTLVMVL